MTTPWQKIVPAISSGEPVSANVANRAPSANAQRTQYLYDRLQDLAAGEALFLHFVNIETDAVPGDLVYYDTTADEYKRAIAAVEYNATVGWFTISESSFVDRSTVSTLACGQRIVSVANFDEQRRRINITSSQGPTRDGRQKPDIAAPGTDVVAASGFTPGAPWVAMTGTSMASPYVAGVVALMLAANRQLTGAQVGP